VFLKFEYNNIDKVCNFNFKTISRAFCDTLLTYPNIIDSRKNTIDMRATNSIDLRIITRFYKEI